MLYLGEKLDVGDELCDGRGIAAVHADDAPLVQFGYATIEFAEDCLLGRKGTVVRGHSFHYSKIASRGELAMSYHVRYSMSGKEEMEGFRLGNVLASYIHLHFRANPAVAESLVAAIRHAQSSRTVTA
jgi:cobyrinic acid a,c-diamide synthase